MDCTLSIKFFTLNAYDDTTVSAIEMDDGDVLYDIRYLAEINHPDEHPGWYVTMQSHSAISKGRRPAVTTLDEAINYINAFNGKLPPAAEVARRVLMWCQKSKPHPKLDVEIVSLIESLTQDDQLEVHRVHAANPASQH